MPATTDDTADLAIQNHGTFFLFHPLTDAARAWIGEHFTNRDDAQFFGHALVVEHRYARELARLATQDGLRVV